MQSRRAARVRKRDGHEESFDALRLRASIAAALEDAGADRRWAAQFQETVCAHLDDVDAIVESEQIATWVDFVLRQYDCVEAAERFAAARRAQREAVGALRVHVAEGGTPRSSPWDRRRAQHALERASRLDPASARRIARHVERRLAAMGQRHLTGRLVAAALDNECRVQGLRGGRPADERAGPPRRALRTWLGGGALPPPDGVDGAPQLAPSDGDPRAALGGHVLASFALEEVLSRTQAEALRRGAFLVLGLGDWLRPLRVRLQPAPGEDEASFWRRVAGETARAHEVRAFWPGDRAAGDLGRQAPRWLRPGGARLRLATADPALAADWAADGQWHAMPAGVYLGLPAARRAHLAAAARTVLAWQPPRPLPTPADRVRRVLHGAAVVNLRAAAAEAPELDTEAFLATLGEAADAAAGALAALGARAHPGPAPRVTLLPCGVDAALRRLLPDPVLRRARARRVLLAVRDLLARRPRRQGLRVDEAFPPHAEDAGARLAEREGMDVGDDHRVGWSPAAGDEEGVRLALDVAPWLEVPAARAHHAGWARLLAAPAPVRDT